MASLLFETVDRHAAHEKLAELLKQKKYAKAECREDSNSEKPYQVWDGPEKWQQTPLSAAEKELVKRHAGDAPDTPTVIKFSAGELEAIGAAMARNMKTRTAAKTKKKAKR
jgi:hypothetical protein